MVAFVVAPIAPGLVLATIFLAYGKILDAEDALRANVVLGYPVAIALGLPIYLLFVRQRWTAWPFYLAAGATIGVVFYWVMPMFIDAAMRLDGIDGGHMVFSATVLPVAMACAAFAAIVFWLIARPDRRGAS